jgi:hypothetical protein
MDSSDTEELTWTAPGPGAWAIGRHVVRPLMPLAAHMHPRAFRAGFATGFARIGVPLRGLDEQLVNGVPYNRPISVIDKPGVKPPPLPILKLLMRIHPELRRCDEQVSGPDSHNAPGPRCV